MNADEVKKAEGRAYAKGYAAGRKRVETDIDRAIERERERQRFDAFYCAALTGLLQAGTWCFGDKKWTSTQDYVRGAKDFATKSLDSLRHLP